MLKSSGICPDSETLAAYVDHGLEKRERTQLEQHIASCSICISVIAGVISTLAELQRLKR